MSIVAEVIKKGFESSEPQNQVLAWLANYEGKYLDKRLMKKLNEAIPGYDFYYRTIAGMTNLCWKDTGSGLLLTYGAAIVNTTFIKEHNPAWFEAMVERNALREQALKETKTMARLEKLAKLYLKCKAEIDGILEPHKGVFDPDKYEIQRALGLRDD